MKRKVCVGAAIVFALVFTAAMIGNNTGYSQASGIGEQLFQSNCLGCHSIGGGDGIGPDLQGVAQMRDREWLAQFIINPQAMVDAGDEAAVQLVKEYKMVMPSLKLSNEEVDEIVVYLESTSALGGQAGQQGGAGSQSASANKAGSRITVPLFALYGVLGACLLFVLTGVFWRNRLRRVRRG